MMITVTLLINKHKSYIKTDILTVFNKKPQ